MKTIELCEEFYNKIGKPMISEHFHEYEDKIVCGVSGSGSDCYGFDDDISADHDSGIGFMMWLSDELYDKIGLELSRKYNELPDVFENKKRAKVSNYGSSHFGVKKISDYFLEFTGYSCIPVTCLDWLRIPEYGLSAISNGKVFRDDEGYFSAIRESFLNEMPNDVLLKKISLYSIQIAQYGQYNFKRCCNHKEYGAAVLALSKFVESYTNLIYLLNNKHSPYYKWSIKGISNLEIFSETEQYINKLLTTETNEDNFMEKFETIEILCKHICDYLRENQISTIKDNYLEPHAYNIRDKIKNAHLRELHILEGL